MTGWSFRGLQESLLILRKMTESERKKILDDIAKKDPNLSEVLKKNLISFEDLQLMTDKMLADFMKLVNIRDLSLALRSGSLELRQFFLKKLPKRMAEDIEEVVNGPKLSASEVKEARERIMKQVVELVDKGVLVLSQDEKYV